ncbi:MAG: hypothetical protein IKR73_10185 [Oscillospiraceae bacterium]|nr:hypothetical protein [Oscillospiraceae bacterium]
MVLPSLLVGDLLFRLVYKKAPVMQIPLILLIPVGVWLMRMAGYIPPQLPKPLLYPVLTVSRGIIAYWAIQVTFLAMPAAVKIVESGRKYVIVGICAAGLVSTVLLSYKNGGVDLNNLGFGKYPLLFFLTGIFGTVAWLGLARLLHNVRPLLWVGENSLFLMATHLPLKVNMVFMRIGQKLQGAIPSVPPVIIIAAMLACEIAVEVVMLWVWNRLTEWIKKCKRAE